MRTLVVLCCISYSLYASTLYNETIDAIQKGDIPALSFIINNPLGQTLTKEEVAQLLVQAQKIQTTAYRELNAHYKKPSLIPFIGISALVGTAFVVKLFKPSRLLPPDQQKVDRTWFENICTVVSVDRAEDFFADLFSTGLHDAEDLKKIKMEAGERTGGALAIITSSAGAWKLYDRYLQKKNKVYFDKMHRTEEAIHILQTFNKTHTT